MSEKENTCNGSHLMEVLGSTSESPLGCHKDSQNVNRWKAGLRYQVYPPPPPPHTHTASYLVTNLYLRPTFPFTDVSVAFRREKSVKCKGGPHK